MPAESPARSACRPLRPTLRVSGVSRVFRVFRFPGFLWSLEFLGFLELLGFFMCFRALGFEDLKVIRVSGFWRSLFWFHTGSVYTASTRTVNIREFPGP